MRNRSILSLSGLIILTGAVSGYAAEMHGLGYSDTPLVPGTHWHIHDGDRPQPRIVTSGKFSDMATAPSDAIVLFDGKDFSRWKAENGGPIKWKLEDGYMETVPRAGRILTKDKFGDFQMHLEFATPEKTTDNKGNPLKGQARGNNGVLIFGKYEIQVLDSYDNQTYPDGQCAAIYGQTPPLVNASRPPGQWQTYDIVFQAPHWNDSGEMVRKGYVTLFHNGVLVHNKRELLGGTTHRAIVPFKPDDGRGGIVLYEHGNPVRFRNIWIRPIGEYDNPKPDSNWPEISK